MTSCSTRTSNGASRSTAAGRRSATQPVLRSNNGDMLLAAAEAGLGLALLPSFIAAPAIERRHGRAAAARFPARGRRAPRGHAAGPRRHRPGPRPGRFPRRALRPGAELGPVLARAGGSAGSTSESCAGGGRMIVGGGEPCRAEFDGLVGRDVSDPRFFASRGMFVDIETIQHPDEFCRSASRWRRTLPASA